MGKTKQIMRSLRSRLPSFKVKRSSSTPTSSGSSASSRVDAPTSAVQSSSSPSLADYRPYTPPTTAPTTLCTIARDLPARPGPSSLPGSRQPSPNVQQRSSPSMSCGSSATPHSCASKSGANPSSSPTPAEFYRYTPPSTPSTAPRANTRDKPEVVVAMLPSPRSLHRKNQQQYPSPPRSSSSSATYDTYKRLPHALVSSSPAPAEHGISTPPSSPPATPQTVHWLDIELEAPAKVHEVALSCPKDDGDGPDGKSVNARIELVASQAMLDFARKLPLDELSMIGHGIEPQKKLIVEKPQTIYMADLPSRPVLRHRLHGLSVDEGTVASPNEPPKIESYTPRTLSLSSESSDSTWSFACRSARRIEREHQEVKDEEHASSFGSLSGWVVTHNDNVAGEESLDVSVENQSHKSARWSDAASNETFISVSGPSHQDRSAFTMSDEEFDALPEYSDIEDESFISISSPSHQDSSFFTMSDEEFDALPNYSDMEDDPEYDYDYDDEFF